jgi:hypothetical protein
VRVYVLRCVYGIGSKARPECDVWAYRSLPKAVAEMTAKVPSDVAVQIEVSRHGDDEMVLDQWFDDDDARWCITAEDVE